VVADRAIILWKRMVSPSSSLSPTHFAADG
jgi:hypothetical protein